MEVRPNTRLPLRCPQLRNRLKSNHKDTKDTKMHEETRRIVIAKRFFVPLCAHGVFVVRLFKQCLKMR